MEMLIINDAKRDFLFDSMLACTNTFYFWGYRLESNSSDLEWYISNIAEGPISKENDYFNVSIKIKAVHLLISRKQLSNLWLFYEYPSIFFLENEGVARDLMQVEKLSNEYKKIAPALGKYYQVYKSFELDVLRVEKSSNMSSFMPFVSF